MTSTLSGAKNSASKTTLYMFYFWLGRSNLASSDDEDYADQKIKPDASTKTEDESGGCSGDNVNRAGGMRNVTAWPSQLFTDFSRDAIFVHKILFKMSSSFFTAVEISSFS